MRKIASEVSRKSHSRAEKVLAEAPVRVFVISLGCPKNLIDTEYALAALEADMGEIRFCDRQEEADLILVNTCSFIEEAVSESVDAILEVAQRKGAGQFLAVMGCLPLRYKEELVDLLPEVDQFSFYLSPHETARLIATALKKKVPAIGTTSPEAYSPRISTGRPWQQYVKISEGCSNRCTYCLIPKIRGPIKCRPPEEIVDEINVLYEAGAKEITLVAQDLTAYQSGQRDLASFLELLLERTSIPWFRLMYLYPHGINERLLRIIKDSNRICPYLDMPIQHASSNILRAMGRKYDQLHLEKTLELIREYLPEISLRTTVMVGFPGETEEDFIELRNFIERWRFHHLGCFAYSDEEDAPSFGLKEKVPAQIGKERRDEIMALQAHISAEINASFVGQTIDVLIDGLCEETDLLLCGRSRFQAPEVDGQVYINRGSATPGSIVGVKITRSHNYDLVGEVA